MSGFDEWLDGTLSGETPCTVESFAASALGDLPRIDVRPDRVGRADVWSPEVLAEIKRIYAEDEGQ